MADVPAVVQYGQVKGRFVSFRADSVDDGSTPDEVPLTGRVTLTPTVPYMRWRNTNPPRLSALEPIVCQIVDGDLKAPDGLGDVYVVATNQPDADPDTVQWTATFRFDNAPTQPTDTIFNVPAGGVVDLAVVIPAEEQPGVVIVVSAEDREAAEAAAARAEAAAQAAALSETNAATSEATAVSAAETAATDAAQDVSTILTASVEASATSASDSADAAEAAAIRAETAASDVTDTGWVALELPEGYVTGATIKDQAAWRVKNGIAYLKGAASVANPEGNTHVFHLPAAPSPATDQTFARASTASAIAPNVATISGGILYYQGAYWAATVGSTTGHQFMFSGISYPID